MFLPGLWPAFKACLKGRRRIELGRVTSALLVQRSAYKAVWRGCKGCLVGVALTRRRSVLECVRQV